MHQFFVDTAPAMRAVSSRIWWYVKLRTWPVTGLS